MDTKATTRRAVVLSAPGGAERGKPSNTPKKVEFLMKVPRPIFRKVIAWAPNVTKTLELPAGAGSDGKAPTTKHVEKIGTFE